jgi:fructose/tagatose bisphosphate aldolase
MINQYGGAIPETYGVPVEEIQEGIRNGVRKVNIRVVRWGCFSKSLSILMPRQMKAPHVRQMIWRLVMRAET